MWVDIDATNGVILSNSDGSGLGIDEVVAGHIRAIEDGLILWMLRRETKQLLRSAEAIWF
jgi:hypothetical protein